ncbi:MAG: hypothetical protein JWQ02_4336, partial [Capsulimonas sp.]|nr:hypothetical protein [Capsulimonas sp.]
MSAVGELAFGAGKPLLIEKASRRNAHLRAEEMGHAGGGKPTDPRQIFGSNGLIETLGNEVHDGEHAAVQTDTTCLGILGVTPEQRLFQRIHGEIDALTQTAIRQALCFQQP